VGDLVSVRGLNLQGTVASLGEGNAEAAVNVGNVRLQVEMRRLSRVEEAPENPPAEVSLDLGPGLSSMELDMRGLRVEEALIQLEEFMDKAVRDGLSSVRIIHGRGTGVLRQVVREHLARHPLARSVTPESRDHGGDGATAVELA
jgi:DNA mismatch repair protein MutS2